jgi:hypothetical protein
VKHTGSNFIILQNSFWLITVSFYSPFIFLFNWNKTFLFFLKSLFPGFPGPFPGSGKQALSPGISVSGPDLFPARHATANVPAKAKPGWICRKHGGKKQKASIFAASSEFK